MVSFEPNILNFSCTISYAIMLSCWQQYPSERPTFKELGEILDSMRDAPHPYVNLDMAREDLLFPPTYEEKGTV